MLPDLGLFTAHEMKIAQSSQPSPCYPAVTTPKFQLAYYHYFIFSHSCYMILVVTLPTSLFVLRSRLKETPSHKICRPHGQGKAFGLVQTHHGLKTSHQTQRMLYSLSLATAGHKAKPVINGTGRVTTPPNSSSYMVTGRDI